MEEIKPAHRTKVGKSFLPPRPGHPVAVLIGVGGVGLGQRFSVDNERFRIGRGSDNNLTITGDDRVSGNHAHLRFEKGSLFLLDEDSRNGSFVNEQRVKGTAVITSGDRIRFGQSVFEVSEATSV